MRDKYYLRTNYDTYCYFTSDDCNHIGNCSTCPEYIKRRDVSSKPSTKKRAVSTQNKDRGV